MNYEFPENITIDECRAIVAERDEFIEAVRDGFTVFNYNVAFADTFPAVQKRADAIRREMRGLVFRGDELYSRRFHKFFNLNEKEETQFENIDWSKPHYLLEKLDGSMVTPFFSTDDSMEIKWHSKMGETFVSDEVSEWMKTNPDKAHNYYRFCYFATRYGFTPIFEWLSTTNRIVVEHETNNLVLLAMRDNNLGWYSEYDDLKELAEQYYLPIVSRIDVPSFDSTVLESIQKINQSEGVVIVFNDGHMLKVKSDWYLKLHKVKSYLDHEKDLVGVILENKVDDLYSVLVAEDRERVKKFSLELHANIQQSIHMLRDVVLPMTKGCDRKVFATDFANDFRKFYRTFAFKFYGQSVDNSTIEDYIVKQALMNLNSGPKWDAFKKELEWNFFSWKK